MLNLLIPDYLLAITGIISLIIAIVALLITRKEVKLKNKIADINFQKEKLNLYYIPLFRIFQSFMMDFAMTDINDIKFPEKMKPDDMPLFYKAFILRNLEVGSISREYDYLGSAAANKAMIAFVLDFNYFLILNNRDEKNKQEMEHEFLEQTMKSYSVSEKTNLGAVKIFQLSKEYYHGIDETVGVNEMWDKCMYNIQTINGILDKEIFEINKQINNKLAELGFNSNKSKTKINQ